jgi:hypothetical protein
VVLYAAIDIHKHVFQAAVFDPESGEVVEARFSADRESLVRWATEWQGRVESVVIEATTGWRWVWRELVAFGFDVRLAEPEAAIAQTLDCPWQRCSVHFLRETLGHVGKDQQGMVAALLRPIFNADDRDAGRELVDDALLRARSRALRARPGRGGALPRERLGAVGTRPGNAPGTGLEPVALRARTYVRGVAERARIGHNFVAEAELGAGALDCAVDTSTPAGGAMAHVLATFGQFERRLIAQRTKEALAAKKASGVRLGRPPTVPQSVVRRIQCLGARGLWLRAIAETLNRTRCRLRRAGRSGTRRWCGKCCFGRRSSSPGSVVTGSPPLAAGVVDWGLLSGG